MTEQDKAAQIAPEEPKNYGVLKRYVLPAGSTVDVEGFPFRLRAPVEVLGVPENLELMTGPRPAEVES